MKHNNINILLVAGLILMAATSRIVNHELHLYNLAPVAAIGLFGGAMLKDKRFAFLLPLLALFIADLYIEFFTTNSLQRGFYGIEQAFVYGGMMLVTLLGTKLKRISATRVLGFSLAGSAIFFILSNFGSFISGMYGYSFSGFITTYLMAIPFYTDYGTQLFVSTFAGDMLFSGVLFGTYFLLQKAFSPKAEKVKA